VFALDAEAGAASGERGVGGELDDGVAGERPGDGARRGAGLGEGVAGGVGDLLEPVEDGVS
jgi:hypothetical protein